MRVEPVTGDIRTVKLPDREPSYVVNGVYLADAVDNGEASVCIIKTKFHHH